MTDVFISYASEDAYFANELADGLEKNGISCWIAPRNCGADKPYSLQISSAIKACKVFIVLISNFSNDSEHVRNEVDLAFNAGKEMICYRLLDIKPADDLNYYLSRKKWIDCTGDEIGIMDVTTTVQKLLKGTVPTKSVFKKIMIRLRRILGTLLFIAVFFVLILIVNDVANNSAAWKSKSIAEYLERIWSLVKNFDYRGLHNSVTGFLKVLIGTKK